jgi:hypothetical protein
MRDLGIAPFARLHPDTVGEMRVRSYTGCGLTIPMKRHRILDGLLILLLLFAQQAAYAHAISHLGKETPAKEQLAHGKLCDKCVSFEKVSGIAPAGVPVLVSLDVRFVQPSASRYSFRPHTVAAFNSRAPPQFP